MPSSVYLLALVFLPLFGAGDPPGYVARRWQNDMVESTRLLKAQDYDAVLRITNRLAKEMVDLLGPNQESTRAFGIVLVHKALAHAGRGEPDEALWYWYVATSLFPKLVDSDVSAFGTAGEFLKQHPAPDYGKVPSVGTRRIEPPKIVKRVEPTFPHAAYISGAAGVLKVEVIIDETGRVNSPRVVRALAASTLSYAALEAVKQWRFEPARANGKAVPVIFNLSVNYKFP